MTSVVIAPDSFKGSIDADRAALAIEKGWLTERPDDTSVRIPQADGGEGTLDAVLASVDGARLMDAGMVTGPDGRSRHGRWVALPDGTAVVEMAQCSGLPLMRHLDPLRATSRGLGEVMAAAIDSGATRILIGIGGSASTDAGIPVLDALGNRKPPAGGAVILSDVRAPLLGPRGAAAVFGPQKGATEADIVLLEKRLQRAVERLGTNPNSPGAGAAGGVGYALMHWGAVVESGATFVARMTGLIEAFVRADVVLTGEGRFDNQSLSGKVVGNVFDVAQGSDSRLGLIAGVIVENPGVWNIALKDLAGSVETALESPGYWLEAAGMQAARALS